LKDVPGWGGAVGLVVVAVVVAVVVVAVVELVDAMMDVRFLLSPTQKCRVKLPVMGSWMERNCTLLPQRVMYHSVVLLGLSIETVGGAVSSSGRRTWARINDFDTITARMEQSWGMAMIIPGFANRIS